VLHALRSVVAVHQVEEFEVPRPRALLGQANFDRLTRAASAITERGGFETLRLSAAGTESAVLTRLRVALADRLGLEPTSTGGDLLLAIRRAASGWEVLLRTTPRPLSARAWRVCDLPGALNATAAHAMAVLSDPRPNETYVNIGCGSATLVIERLALGPAGRAIGYDIDPHALTCARLNVQASGFPNVELIEADARSLPFSAGSVRTVVADLPYAMRMGSARANQALYPALLREASRVLSQDGHLVVVTTQRRLMEGIVEGWQLRQRVPFTLSHAGGTFNPSIYVLGKQ
jgi:tRNA (guanine6-N2)-methyltransferase